MGLADPAGPIVVVVGSMNTDYVVRVNRRPQDGETVTDAELSVHGGGKGANQAIAAAMTGGAVHMVGRVGDDPAGANLLAELASHGIVTDGIQITPEVATGSAFVTVTPGGANAITVAPGANARMTAADVSASAPLIATTSVLLAQLEIPMAAVARAIQSAGEKTTVIVNCAPFAPLDGDLLARIDVLVANENEAGQLLRREIGDPRDALAAAAEILTLGPGTAVVTLGGDGAAVASASGQWHVPAPRTTPVDTTGAGDAFAGSLSAQLAAGASLKLAVKFAVTVGSATTEHPGARPHVPSHP